MNIKYIDQNGTEIKVGDILKYDEGIGCARAIHEVVLFNGKLSGTTRIGEPFWTEYNDDKPIELMFYQLMGSKDESGICYNAEIIGNINNNPELLSIQTAINIFCEDGDKQ